MKETSVFGRSRRYVNDASKTVYHIAVSGPRGLQAGKIESRQINSLLRGWISYYGKFYKSKLRNFMHYLNVKIASWARRKYKNLRSSEMKAIRWLHGISQLSPTLFAHWTIGATPTLNKQSPIIGAV